MLRAPRFITFSRTHHNDRVLKFGWHAVDQALRARGWRTANWADRSQFFDMLGSSQQIGHDAKRFGAEIQIQTTANHAHTSSSQLERQRHEARIKELSLVERDDIGQFDLERIGVFQTKQRGFGCETQQDAHLKRALDGMRIHRATRVAGNGGGVIPSIDDGFENANILFGDDSSSHPTNQLLGLARKHGTTNDFDMTGGKKRLEGHKTKFNRQSYFG
jgi:hypothetical protein